ncbi:putative membrane protein [Mycobacterium botniense]|uniref:Putative membrane protein n=2 Tax=Mycobacterium botniense TaxID=84962 RepID=A0A7I9XWF0_9MYCO|nr:putative membrane protein [Mycobacterium botniense]
MVAAVVAVAAVAAIGTYLTAPRPGGRMDPASTEPAGAHALVALLRDHGVQVVVAHNIADVEHAARPDALVLVAQTQHLAGDSILERLAKTPADLLLVKPTSRARAALAPVLRAGGLEMPDSFPNCALQEANRAGSVQFGPTDTYVATDQRPVTSCYGGVLVRYRDGTRTITVVGDSHFMTNKGLLRAGNAALAMNLAGSRSRLIWYAPQRTEGETSRSATIVDVIPDRVIWMAGQLWVVVIALALWKGRRLGPLVAENLPVVVRASETVEGLGRLYRSRRARDRAAQALRTAALQRMLTRIGLEADTPAPAVVSAVIQRTDVSADWVHHSLFGPPPATDADLLHLARALDDIERRVTHS